MANWPFKTSMVSWNSQSPLSLLLKTSPWFWTMNMDPTSYFYKTLVFFVISWFYHWCINTVTWVAWLTLPQMKVSNEHALSEVTDVGSKMPLMMKYRVISKILAIKNLVFICFLGTVNSISKKASSSFMLTTCAWNDTQTILCFVFLRSVLYVHVRNVVACHGFSVPFFAC